MKLVKLNQTKITNMKHYFSLTEEIGTWVFLKRLIVIWIFYSVFFVILQRPGSVVDFNSGYFILIGILNAVVFSIQFIQRLNDIGLSKYYVIMPYMSMLSVFQNKSFFFLIASIIAGIFTLYVVFAPCKKNVLDRT